MPIVLKYAPYLYFSDNEMHFPDIPENFPNKTRFRQSNYEGNRDRGWNRRAGEWEASNNHGVDYLGTEWSTILQQIKDITKRDAISASNADVTRPRDKRNMWRDNTRGFFLELRDDLDRNKSGYEQPVPIFYDIDKYYIGGVKYVELSYWFFYALNQYVIITHEGDWEHITLYFREEDFNKEDFPEWIFYSAHNGGSLYRINKENKEKYVKWKDDTHPHVYVSTYGHPSHANANFWIKKHDYNNGKKKRAWETWQQNIPSITTQPWVFYDGAWGGV